jgi:hypothetical protein
MVKACVCFIGFQCKPLGPPGKGSLPGNNNSEFERKNSPDRTSESGHACPCGASVKCPLSDNPSGPFYLSHFGEVPVFKMIFMVKNNETTSVPILKQGH